MNFFLPYFDADVGMFVVNHSKIAKRYMCTWFFVDIISIMPFDTLALLLDAPVFHTLKIVRLVRLLRLFKLIRMFRASRMFRRWEAYMSISHAWNTILQFFCLSVIVAHWLACAWGAVVEVEEHVDARGVTNNWRVAYGVDGASHARQYLASLYWSVMTITTIGYGDVAPVTDGERLLSIFGMVVGCSVYAYTIGAVAGVVERMDKPSTEFYQHLDDLNSFMSENNLPAELRRRLRSYFTYCRQQHRQRHYRHLFNQMTPALRGEVSLYTNSMWVEQVPFFKKASRSEWRGFVTAVTMALEYEVFAPQEMVFRVGELANKMYIVQRGLGANQGRILSTGHYFGEDMLLQSARRTYSVRALTYLDVASLSKQNLTELLERNNFPNTYRQIRRHVLKLAFRRAFVRFARCMASLKASARHDSARMDILRGGAAAAPRSRTEPSSPLRARSGKSRDDSKQEERVRDTCRPASGTHTVRFSLPPLAPLAPPAPPAASESPAPMDVPTAAGSEGAFCHVRMSARGEAHEATIAAAVPAPVPAPAVPPVVADSPGSAAPARHQLWSANSARASTQPSRLGRKETTAAELSRMQFLMERGFSDMGDRLNVVLQLRSEVDVLRHEIAKLRQEQQHRSRVHQLHLVVITVIMLALVALVIAAR